MEQNETMEQIYTFIKDYIREHTYPPTLKEIGKGCYMSRTNATRYVDLLQALGRIARNPKLSRGITLLDDGDDQ